MNFTKFNTHMPLSTVVLSTQIYFLMNTYFYEEMQPLDLILAIESLCAKAETGNHFHCRKTGDKRVAIATHLIFATYR